MVNLIKINKKIIRNGLILLAGISTYKTIDLFVISSNWDYQTLGLVTLGLFFVAWVVLR